MEKTDLAISLDELKHMPRYLGITMYWGGLPFAQESLMFSVDSISKMPKSLREIIFDYYHWSTSNSENTEPPKPIFEILREYCIYYAHAPIWDMNPFPMPGFKKWIKQSFEICDWETLTAWRMKAMDFGLNPF